MNTFICYPKCSTCRKALASLREHGVDVEVRDIKAQPPTVAELREWIPRSGKTVRQWFNTSGMQYREQQLSQKLSAATEEEMLALLSSNGMLVKRPILITSEKVLTGFREAEYSQL